LVRFDCWTRVSIKAFTEKISCARAFTASSSSKQLVLERHYLVCRTARLRGGVGRAEISLFSSSICSCWLSISFCCFSICACCSLTALINTTLTRSYFTPSTSPLPLRVTKTGSTLATSSATKPISAMLSVFQLKETGRRRLIRDNPELNELTFCLY